jgi:hypothetical protein
MSNEKIKQFNEILDSFLIQVSPLVGTSYHHYFQQVVKANSILPIESFLTHVLPMRDKILNRDETYFINTDNHKDKIQDDNNILNEILRLQGIYNQIDETSKSNVWDIFQALLFLGEEYLIMNRDRYNLK